MAAKKKTLLFHDYVDGCEYMITITCLDQLLDWSGQKLIFVQIELSMTYVDYIIIQTIGK